MKPKLLKIGSVTIGGERSVFILGPCVIESEKFVWRMARSIEKICAQEDVDLIFKASYDKANRTSVHSFRGVGVREGCEILSAIGCDLKISVTTDVHSPAEAEIAGGKVEMLQIPAFLCRQTDCRLRQREILFHGTRHDVWLQQSHRRYALTALDAQSRLPGDF